MAKLVRASDVVANANYPKDLDPYPKGDSYSAQLGLGVFDLITPDGLRTWVVAGWQDDAIMRAWTVEDFIKNRSNPTKYRIDQPRYFAPLTHINSDSDLRDKFMADYMAVYHQTGEQFYKFGCDLAWDSFEWVGRKIMPYANGGEHIVRDINQYFRQLIVDPVRANNPKYFQAVDAWEVTASWHDYFGGMGRQPERAAHTNSVQYLYRLYDRDGQLLYIGVTDNVLRRWKEHSKEKFWWDQVHTFTKEEYPDRSSVENAERLAIKTESPTYNIAHAVRKDMVNG